MAQNQSLLCRRKLREARHDECVAAIVGDAMQEFGSKLIQQILRLGAVRRATRQRLVGARPARAQHGHDLPAQIVAGKPNITVARILDPAQLVFLGVGGQLGSTDLKQGPSQKSGSECRSLGHGGQAGNARTAQQLQQQRLGLIVPVLGGQQRVAGAEQAAECGIARAACRGFRTFPALRSRVHVANRERDVQCAAGFRAGCDPVIGMVLEAMMDVGRGQWQIGLRASQRMAEMQQYGRVQAAAERHPIPRAGRVTVQKRGQRGGGDRVPHRGSRFSSPLPRTRRSA